jgi:hypothetical protein
MDERDKESFEVTEDFIGSNERKEKSWKESNEQVVRWMRMENARSPWTLGALQSALVLY